MDDDGTFGMVVELSGEDSLDVFRLSRKDLVGVRKCWDCEELNMYAPWFQRIAG